MGDNPGMNDRKDFQDILDLLTRAQQDPELERTIHTQLRELLIADPELRARLLALSEKMVDLGGSTALRDFFASDTEREWVVNVLKDLPEETEGPA